MTDTEKLNRRIEQSGYKKKYIAKVLDVAESTLSRKINNSNDFTSTEIDVLCALLGIDDLEEKEAIFFAR